MWPMAYGRNEDARLGEEVHSSMIGHESDTVSSSGSR
jgi:hypothetical protein